MTEYVILRELDEGIAFVPIGESSANGDEAAINTFLATDDNADKYGEGKYAAVPKRSWKVHEKKKKISFV